MTSYASWSTADESEKARSLPLDDPLDYEIPPTVLPDMCFVRAIELVCTNWLLANTSEMLGESLNLIPNSVMARGGEPVDRAQRIRSRILSRIRKSVAPPSILRSASSECALPQGTRRVASNMRRFAIFTAD